MGMKKATETKKVTANTTKSGAQSVQDAEPKMPRGLTEPGDGPTRSVTLSLNRWRLALKRLDQEINVAANNAKIGSRGITLVQRPVGSMLEGIRARVGEYREAISLHRKLLAFKWLLRGRIAERNQELGINALLCEQEVTRKRIEVLKEFIDLKTDGFRVQVEEVPELFEGVVEGRREITGPARTDSAANEFELGDALDEIPLSRMGGVIEETWRSKGSAAFLTVEILTSEQVDRLRQEHQALARRMVAIGDEIAEANRARLTLEVPVDVADEILV